MMRPVQQSSSVSRGWVGAAMLALIALFAQVMSL
jgi:hypothetical protein